jgi:hypothetical protein
MTYNSVEGWVEQRDLIKHAVKPIALIIDYDGFRLRPLPILLSGWAVFSLLNI